jgi:hypothetical protein
MNFEAANTFCHQFVATKSRSPQASMRETRRINDWAKRSSPE